MGSRVRRVCTLAAVAVGIWVGPADAQSVYTGVQPPVVGAVDTGAPGGSAGAVRSSSAALQTVQSTSGGLAFTGTDVVSLVAIGGGAIAIGALLKRRAQA